ncbi:hypothetical protein [Pandoraea apista]|uniref:hypothetical protein n=1 Tax=Pandoraea apista TaxID=93218 RepID=UPI00117E0A01|nr:hypothetical protein [Pandoraea apista]
MPAMRLHYDLLPPTRGRPDQSEKSKKNGQQFAGREIHQEEVEETGATISGKSLDGLTFAKKICRKTTTATIRRFFSFQSPNSTPYMAFGCIARTALSSPDGEKPQTFVPSGSISRHRLPPAWRASCPPLHASAGNLSVNTKQ